MDYRKPNFFIIGAPKCGTTAMSEYLRAHPNVFFSDPKEPHFFNEDFANRYTQSLNDYRDIFSTASPKHSAIGEGSIFYLVSSVAVRRILEFNPGARFIVMLRNPIDAVHAWHSQALYNFGEEVLDFRQAWNLQDQRSQGIKVPPDCREVKTLMYGPLFKYGEQLERLYRLVPKENIHVIVFEDFTNNTSMVYEKLLQFLNVAPIRMTSFNRVNANTKYRSWQLEFLLRHGSRLKHALGVKTPFGIRGRLAGWNTAVEPRDALAADVVESLADYFRDDVERLSEVLGFDLTGWIHPAQMECDGLT